MSVPGFLTLWHPAAFGVFEKKRRNTLWLCTGISPLLFGSRTWSKRQKMRQGCGFVVSDVISGGLLGQLGPLCLALGANH